MRGRTTADRQGVEVARSEAVAGGSGAGRCESRNQSARLHPRRHEPLTAEDLAIQVRIKGRAMLLYALADQSDALIMCRAGDWRRNGFTGALSFAATAIRWPVDEIPLNVGGCVGRYI
jgi:hypothetical protein